MHYKDRTEARVGDRIKFPSVEYVSPAPGEAVKSNAIMREGVIMTVHAEAGTCNARVMYPHLEITDNGAVRIPRLVEQYVTLRDCEKA